MTDTSFDSDCEFSKVLYTLNPFALRQNNASALTATILLAYLHRHEILSAPEATNKSFTWCYMLFTVEDCIEMGEPDPRILYICDENVAQWILERHKTVFLLVLTREHKTPEWIIPYRNQTILLSTQSSYHLVGSVILNLFSGILCWQYELDRIVLSHGSLTELLNEGALVIQNFMCITDSGYNLVAHTESIEPPDEGCRFVVENGCFPLHIIDYLENHILDPASRESRAKVDDSNTVTPLDVVHLPVYFNESHFFHLSMPCTSVLGTAAARDFLNMFATRLTKLCGSFWDEIIEIESPWHRILTNYIRRVPMEEEYVRTQLKLTAIPSAKQFKLLCIELCHSDSPSKRSLVVDIVRKLNKSQCYPFAYNGSLLALYYSDSEDLGLFSGPRVEQEIFESGLSVSPQMRVGLSKTFHDIQEIDIAYQQACLALNLAPFIVAERKLASVPVQNYCFAFESVFSYYMFIEMNKDNRLSKSSMRYGLLKTLAIEDAELGAETVKLLWTYLCNERNATAVSKQLHVHRNTVLYHIEKIEKRFAINLGDPVTRTCLLDEFHLYFLTKGFSEEPDYEALLRINEVSERAIE